MDISLYGSLNSKLKSVASGIKNITFENGILIFTTNDDKIINVTVPNMHLHSNKNILDKFTVVDEKLYYDGRDLEVECHEHVNKGVLDGITSVKVSEWNNKVDKVNGKSLVDDVEIERLKNVVSYDDTDIKASIPTNISQLTNDSDYATENFVTNKIAEASLGGGSGEVDLSSYQTKTDNSLSTTAKTIVGAINENKSSLDNITTNKFDDISINGTELSMEANGVVKKTITLPNSGENKKILQGVSWLNIGDSLSAYDGSEFGYSTPTTWCKVAERITGATIKNCAVGGAGLGSMSNLMTQTNTTTTDISNAQIITIMLYGNDLLDGLGAGNYNDVADQSGSTCCARLKGLVNYIQTYNKTAPIIFIQEPMRLDGFGANSWNYATELRKTCNYLQIPYFDLQKCCGFNKNTYDTYYHTDKLHLKPVGYERLGGLNAKAVCSFFVVTS